MDSLLQFYRATRERFPLIVKLADKQHVADGWDLNDEFAYSWFQSLANLLNANMRKEAGLDICEMVFEYMRQQYLDGSPEVRNCIDVSFVENLFWQVSSKKAKSYWLNMPDVLKDLYLGFHAKPPC